MGTRNLTAVYLDGTYPVAQYCQWDGYLEGQGATIVAFLKNVVDAGELDRFKSQVRKCYFLSEAELETAYKDFSSNGWMTMDQAEAFKKSAFGHLSRDTGAQILELIHNSTAERFGLSDQLRFTADSLFCEWAYLVNLDDNVLEIFEGFNTTPLEPHERFYSMEEFADEKYHPVKLLATVPIDANISEAYAKVCDDYAEARRIENEELEAAE